MPIHCQSSVNLLPIQVNPPPMQHKSSQCIINMQSLCQSITNPMPILDQSTNRTFQCLFATNPPILDKFSNSFHFSQSIADPKTNPSSILCQSKSTQLSANLSAIWVNPFPIPVPVNPVPIHPRSGTNLAAIPVNPSPIQFHFSANPRPIKYQYSVNSRKSTNPMPIQ